MSFTRGFGRLFRRLSVAARDILAAVGDRVFRIFGGLLVLLAAGSIGTTSYTAFCERRAPDIHAIWPWVVMLLVAAALIQIEPAILDRLKKVGPVEFYEQQAREVVPELSEIIQRVTEIGRVGVDVADTPQELDPEERYFYRKADRLVDHLIWRDVALGDSQELQQLLSKLGMIALDQGEWARSIDRLSLLMKSTDGAYKPEVIWHKLACAQFLQARNLEGGTEPLEAADHSLYAVRRRELLLHARESARRAVAATKSVIEPWNYEPLYMQAQILHFLGEFSSAVGAYGAVLERQPDHAPAKYNRTVLFCRNGQLERAWAELDSLDSTDQEVEKIVSALKGRDHDLDLLFKNPDHSEKIEILLHRIQDPSTT